MPDAAPFLVADIGGTNARFGLTGPGGLAHSRVLACADFPTLEDAARAYLADAAPAVPPRQAAFAIAGPVTGDLIQMTNHAWTFTISATRAALELDRLEVINDFTAVALSLPHLGDADRRAVGGGTPRPRAVIAAIGPGSGLGMSGLVPAPDGGWIPLAGEGGHATMPAADSREAGVLAILARRFDHISAERVISGQGLQNLAAALTALAGLPPSPRTPAEITQAARDGSDAVCVEAVEMFCAMLGTAAGNLALTLGARGGVYIAGGIVPKLGELFHRSRFRERFIGKGRMSVYLDPIPTYVITHSLPAFLGLRALLES
ncbi:MAG TPA: glucokinase [Azospirillaceae bacterium]|nr:glucokinase [Azospirillaceae bacterium]